MDRELLKRRYWLQDLLGEGGMGQVYRGIDIRTRAQVAIKLLRDEAASDRKLLRSLWREVRAAARLSHPNIVRVIDYGQTDEELPFFVMEFVPGHSLEALRPQLSVRDVLELTDLILSALAYAHARGVVHRDLKPENILVVESEDGILSPKLVDFGVAQIGGLQAAERGITADNMPVSDFIVGTPAYMAPEQAQGLTRKIGPESDLYALGVILYEFIAGRLPFDADNAMGILLQHVSAPVPALAVPPEVDVPTGLQELVLTLLAKTPEERPAFAADVRRSLRRLNLDEASDTAPEQLRTHDNLIAGMGPTIDSETMLARVRNGAVTGPALFEDIETGVNKTGIPEGSQQTRELMLTLFGDEGGQEETALPLVPGLFGIRDTPFVGRTAERDEAWKTLEEALAENNTRFLVISGEPGLGKSRLARWLSERAEEEGLIQTMGCGIGPNATLAAGGLRALVERHFRIHGLDRDDTRAALDKELVATGHFESQELGPLMAFLRPAASPSGVAPPRPIEPSAAVGRIIRAATRKRPVLLFLDDLAGPTAAEILDLLDLLAASRGLSPIPVLAVVTVDESSESATDGVWFKDLGYGEQKRLQELLDEDSTTWIRLEPMVDDEIAELARSVLPLTEQLVGGVVTRSLGNPSYSIQLMQHWIHAEELVETQNGQLSLEHASANLKELPTGLGELLRSRFGRVLVGTDNPQATRDLIARAAVAGRRFPVAVVERLVEVEGRPELADELDELIETMISEDFWVEVDDGVMQFSQSKLLDLALEHFLSRADTLRLHALMARVKRELLADRIGEAHGEIAQHLEAGGLYEEATAEMLAAARQAMTWGQYATARSWLTRLRSMLDKHTLTDTMKLADEADLLLATCAVRTGSYDVAEEHLQHIEERRRSDARRSVLASTLLLRARLTHKRGNVDLALQQYVKARAVFDEQENPRDVANALLGQAEVHVTRGTVDRVSPLASAARSIFVALGENQLAAHSLVVEGKAARMREEPEEALEFYRRAEEAFENAGARHVALEARLWSSDVLLYMGRLDEARDRYQAILEPLAELGDTASLIAVYRALGRIHRDQKKHDESVGYYQRALELAESIGASVIAGRVHNGLGELERAREHFEEAIQHYQACIEICREAGASASVAVGTANLGLVYSEMDDWKKAAESFARSVQVARSIGNRQMEGAFLGCEARAQAELSDWESARQTMSSALERDTSKAITETDFIKALQFYAERFQTRDPEHAADVARVAASRWRSLGDEEKAQTIERQHSLKA